MARMAVKQQQQWSSFLSSFQRICWTSCGKWPWYPSRFANSKVRFRYSFIAMLWGLEVLASEDNQWIQSNTSCTANCQDSCILTVRTTGDSESLAAHWSNSLPSSWILRKSRPISSKNILKERFWMPSFWTCCWSMSEKPYMHEWIGCYIFRNFCIRPPFFTEKFICRLIKRIAQSRPGKSSLKEFGISLVTKLCHFANAVCQFPLRFLNWELFSNPAKKKKTE